MRIKYTKDAIKFLEKQPKGVVYRIRTAIDKLKATPQQGDIAIMKGYTDGRKRLRVGNFRIIYRNTVENQIEVLLVIEIGNRGDIYK